MLRIVTALNASNNAGESVPLPDGFISSPAQAKIIANTVFPDPGETPSGLSGIVGYNDIYWTGAPQPIDI